MATHELRLTTPLPNVRMRGMKKPPPKARKREMTACHHFVAKLGTVPFPAAETETCRAAGIPENSITRWREGRKIHLDHACRLAKKLGISLDWLADDERQQPPGEEMSSEMREVMRVVQRLGAEVAMARLIQAPGPAEAGPVKRHSTPSEPENPGPKPRRSRKARS